ncbi:UNVERIFIED_CONTAM: hypothetical protein PYX00_006682 [Menopon gallinae]|uniref:Bcl-2 Bcl-2 homology region 1-3 domain-containing protein n=1 Tax=Menopon gallinae TaxID=328185 RepID=A0AAW2HXU8_9NEOP
MAYIKLTYQGPDETEAHEIVDETASAGEPPGNRDNIAEEDGEQLSVPSAPQSRRGSNFSVSLQPSIQLLQRRKFSFPAALPSNFLGLEGATVGGSARRRFSNVSDAVTRKLSSTIRWRTSEAQCQEIVTVGKSLCSQYIRSRLRRSGYLNKKCGLQRLRSAVSLSGGVLFREVFPDLLGLGVELERMHPKLYINVMRQASSLPGGRITSDKEPGTVLTAVYRELLKTELTWEKLVSLYAVAGGLAVDCVRQGHYDYLISIVEAMEEILEEELAQWIHDKGGWHALTILVRPPTTNWSAYKVCFLASSFIIITLLVVFLLRLYGISTFL